MFIYYYENTVFIKLESFIHLCIHWKLQYLFLNFSLPLQHYEMSSVITAGSKYDVIFNYEAAEAVATSTYPHCHFTFVMVMRMPMQLVVNHISQ